MSGSCAGWREWLPYGEPFRFVDEILRLELPGLLISSAGYERHRRLIEAHRVAGTLVVPGVLLAEQAAQSAWLLGRCSGWLQEGDVAVLGRLNCVFHSSAPAASPVIATVRRVVQSTETVGFRATLESKDIEVATVTMAVRKHSA